MSKVAPAEAIANLPDTEVRPFTPPSTSVASPSANNAQIARADAANDTAQAGSGVAGIDDPEQSMAGAPPEEEVGLIDDGSEQVPDEPSPPRASIPDPREANGTISKATDEPTAIKSSIRRLEGRYGCDHGPRLCKIRGSCCDSFYTCRNCHDYSSDHTMKRSDIIEMVCMLCTDTYGAARVQPVSNKCVDCHTQMSKFFCAICRVFSESNDIAHCKECETEDVEPGVGYCVYISTCPHMTEKAAAKRAEKEAARQQKIDADKMKKAIAAYEKLAATEKDKIEQQAKLRRDSAGSTGTRWQMRSILHPHLLHPVVPHDEEEESNTVPVKGETKKAIATKCSDCPNEIATHAHVTCDRADCDFSLCVGCFAEHLALAERGIEIALPQVKDTEAPQEGEGDTSSAGNADGEEKKEEVITAERKKSVVKSKDDNEAVKWSKHTMSLETSHSIQSSSTTDPSQPSDDYSGTSCPSCDINVNSKQWESQHVKSLRKWAQGRLETSYALQKKMTALPWNTFHTRLQTLENDVKLSPTTEQFVHLYSLVQTIAATPESCKNLMPHPAANVKSKIAVKKAHDPAEHTAAAPHSSPALLEEPEALYAPKFHKEHALHYSPGEPDSYRSCFVCSETIESTVAYGCSECHVDAHLLCVMPEISTESMAPTDEQIKAAKELMADRTLPAKVHEHPLSFFPKRYWGGFSCNICGEHGGSTAFACDLCNWDAHPTCILFPALTRAWKNEKNDPTAKVLVAGSDWERMEENLESIFGLAYKLTDGSEYETTVAHLREDYMQRRQTLPAWGCCRVGCETTTGDLEKLETAVFRCSECKTNLCVECATHMWKEGELKLTRDGLDCDATTIEAWIKGDRNNEPINMNDLNARVAPVEEQRTHLMMAIDRHDVKKAAWLLQNGADAHLTDDDGRSALHYAVDTGKVAFVQFVVAYRPSIVNKNRKKSVDDGAQSITDESFLNATDSKGDPKSRPLMLAIKANYIEIVQCLAQALVQAKASMETSVWYACSLGHDAVLELLLSNNADVNDSYTDQNGRKTYAIHVACEGGHTEIVKILLKYQVEIRVEDSDRHTCLYQALLCKYERPELLQLLLTQFSIPESKQRNRIKKASGVVSSNVPSLKFRPPFEDQEGNSTIVDHIDALVMRKGFGSHLEKVLCLPTAHSRVFDEPVRDREYPGFVLEAAGRANLNIVDVLIKQLAKRVFDDQAAGIVVKPAPAPVDESNAPASAPSDEPADGSNPEDEANAGQKAIPDDPDAPAKEAAAALFQFRALPETKRSAIKLHAPVYLLLQYPHIYYANEGGEVGLQMVRFALDFMSSFPKESSDERTRGEKCTVDDYWISKEADARNGYQIMHAACASPRCTPELIQFLLSRKASPISIALTKKQTSAGSKAIGGKEAYAAAQAGLSLADELSIRTPLNLLLRNQSIDLQVKRRIARDLAKEVLKMYTAEMVEANDNPSPSNKKSSDLPLIHLFARQLSADEQTASIAWEECGIMFGDFARNTVPNASAAQLCSALIQDQLPLASQKKLLFESEVRPDIIMNLLPLLAGKYKIQLLKLLATNENTQYVHNNSTREQLSMITVMSNIGFASGVEAILNLIPSPNITNSIDVVGRAPLKIALDTWRGKQEDAMDEAQTFIQRVVTEYRAALQPRPDLTAEQVAAIEETTKRDLLNQLAALPVATINHIYIEYAELKIIREGLKSVDLLAYTPYTSDSEYGQPIRFNLRPDMPAPDCPIRICARKLTVYCPQCARYFCPTCLKVAHADIAEKHELVPIKELKENYLMKYDALSVLLKTTRAVTMVDPISGKVRLSPIVNQQHHRHAVMKLLLSAAGRFDLEDILAAIRHWSLDVMNFRTRAFGEEKKRNEAGEEEDEEDANQSNTLVPNRSILHLAAFQQDPDLVDNVLMLLLKPKPTYKLLNAHRPFRYLQLLMWGDEQAGVALSGMKFYHHDTALTVHLISDAHGHHVRWPFRDSSQVFKNTGGQSLLYVSFDYPLLFTHYELLFDSSLPQDTQPIQWQLCGSNDEDAAMQRRTTIQWFVIHRFTNKEVQDAAAQSSSAGILTARMSTARRRSRENFKNIAAVSAAALAVPPAPTMNFTGRLATVDLSTNHQSVESAPSAFTYYRWLFTAAYGQSFSIRYDELIFYRHMKKLNPMSEGCSHDSNYFPKPPFGNPIVLQPSSYSSVKHMLVKYPDGQHLTRPCVIYKFDSPVKVTGYSLVASDEPNFAPSAWRLYGTNDATAENYNWNEEIDSTKPQEQVWTLIDQQSDPNYPAPNGHIMDVNLFSSTDSISLMEAEEDVIQSYQYYRLDILSIFDNSDFSAVTLQGAKCMDARGQVIQPSSWINPRGRSSDDDSNMSVDNLGQDSDSFWRDSALGSTGFSELIAVFDKPVNLHSYQFARCMQYTSSWYEPRTWTLAGSNDKQNWQVLSTIADAKRTHVFKPFPLDLEHDKEEEAELKKQLRQSGQVVEEEEDKDADPLASKTLRVRGHHHALQVYPKRYSDGFSCDICHDYSCKGPAFSCSACSWDAMIECAWKDRDTAVAKESTLTEEEFKAKHQWAKDKYEAGIEEEKRKKLEERGRVISVNSHPHPLRFFASRYSGGYGCDICHQGGEGIALACDDCNWDAHPHCAWGDRNADAPAEDNVTEAEFNAELEKIPLEAAKKAQDLKELTWSRSVFVRREDAMEERRKREEAAAAAAAAAHDGSDAAASSNYLPQFKVLPLLRSTSEQLHVQLQRKWEQHVSNDGKIAQLTDIIQPSDNALSEKSLEEHAASPEFSSSGNDVSMEITPQQIAEAAMFAPNADPKEHVRIATERVIVDMVRKTPRALVHRVLAMFEPDEEGLTPRDYALTLAVSRILRKWERVLHLATVGTDAIVVFDQPQLIDSDVFEQFFRNMIAKVWNTLTCAHSEDIEVDSPEKVLLRMKKLAYNIEIMGLACSIYNNGVTAIREDEHNQAKEKDPTAMLLITASYSRLLLECSSRALQDDPQYEAHRKLASDMCLPADLQGTKCAKRVPFTTAQRQALVMRILSGLGTDLDQLATLQHYKSASDAREAELEEARNREAAEAAADAEADAKAVKDPDLRDAGTKERETLQSIARRIDAKREKASALPAIARVMDAAREAKKADLLKSAAGALSTLSHKNKAVDGSEAVEMPPILRHHSDVLHGEEDVHRVETEYAAMNTTKTNKKEGELVMIPMSPNSPDVNDTMPASEKKEPDSSNKDAAGNPVKPPEEVDADLDGLDDRTGLPMTNPSPFVKKKQPTAATPLLTGTDKIDQVKSQSATLNVLQMVARDEIRGLSLMHSEGEKQMLEHAWRHFRISDEEFAYNEVMKAQKFANDRNDYEMTAEETAKRERAPPSFPLPTNGKGRVQPLLQPFTRAAFKFSLREGEAVVNQYHSLAMLRSYAGDRVAFFFAFVSYTLVWQWLLFAPGLALTIFSFFFPSNPALPWNSVFVMVWSTVFIDRWHRKSSELAYKYGTMGFEDTEACRPQFQGWRVKMSRAELKLKEDAYNAETQRRIDNYNRLKAEYAATHSSAVLKELTPRKFDPACLLVPKWLHKLEQSVQEADTGVVPITCRIESAKIPKRLRWYQHLFRFMKCQCRKPRETEKVLVIIAQRVNPVTDEKEDFYPTIIYYTKIALSTIFMLLQMALVVFINVEILQLKATYANDQLGGFAPYWSSFIGILTGVTMKILHTVYLILTESILDWENHRTESSHANAKIIKTFCFAFVNSYYSLFYIALTADPQDGAASHELAVQLVSVMVSRTITGVLFEDLLPYVVFRFMKRKLENSAKAAEKAKANIAPASRPSSARPGGRNPAAVGDSSTLAIRIEPNMTNTTDRLEPSPRPSTNKVAPEPQAMGKGSTAPPAESKQAWAGDTDPKASGSSNAPAHLRAASSSMVDSTKLRALKKDPVGPDAADAPLSYRVGTESLMKGINHDAELEIQRPASPSLLDQYLEIITQIGYVTCFSAVFPAAPLLVIGSLGLISHGLLYKYLHIAQRPIQERAADIGAWVSVLTFLSFTSILTNCILIFHTSDQWEPYSGSFPRQTAMLGFALILFIFKVIIMALIPDQAGWVTTKLLATKYKQDKLHANEVTSSQSNAALNVERAYLKQKLEKFHRGAADSLAAKKNV